MKTYGVLEIEVQFIDHNNFSYVGFYKLTKGSQLLKIYE